MPGYLTEKFPRSLVEAVVTEKVSQLRPMQLLMTLQRLLFFAL